MNLKNGLLPVLTAALFILSVSVLADLRPETLEEFSTAVRGELKGFALSPRKSVAPLLDKPAGAIATRHEGYARGSSLIVLSVLRFSNITSRDMWNEQQRGSSASWGGDLSKDARAGKVIYTVLQRDRHNPKVERAVAFVGPMVLMVLTVQQTELHRKHPQLAKQALSNEELHQRLETVIEKLVEQAKRQR